ncbi:MAG: hypothetical protein HY000_11955 [Planctomycetes bacterium]|nr:hypothetical protein [Planctomycetota bacterium]
MAFADVDPPVVVSGTDASVLIREAAHQHLASGQVEQLQWLCAHPEAPEDLLPELCDRGICLDELGHRSGPRKLLERLAERFGYDEAINTLAVQLYTDAEVPADAFVRFIEQYRDRGWMLETLAHQVPSSQEKAQAFCSVAAGHPDGQHFLELRNVKLQELEAQSATAPAEIDRLFASGEPRVWRALAGNPNVSTNILEQLASTTGIRLARQIRTDARANLARKSQ